MADLDDALAALRAQQRWGVNQAGVIIGALLKAAVSAQATVVAQEGRIAQLEARVTALEAHLPPAP